MKRSAIFQRLLSAGLISCMCLGLIGCGATDSEKQPPQSQIEQSDADNQNQEPQVEKDGAESENPVEQSVEQTGNQETEPTDNQSEQQEPEQPAEEVPILRDAISEKIDALAGCAVTLSEINDPKVWDIVTTHFSAVSIGNELKPDALVGYSCTVCPGTETIELNGEEMVVPKLDYSRAEAILNKFVDWNAEHPEKIIKIRGHVLVWHSQTPEWFFHVDYDKNKDYVDKDTMNKRLEWYIKTVLTHFTGEDSKYKDLFYGWDVVNEAISDATGTLRTDHENPNESLSEDRHGSNSSWWHIYESNEFIINAFKYANKYAPETLELYYNDYNECMIKKRNGIIDLLKAIKEQEGAPGEGTRITAMGMQGHYGMDSPGFTDIQSSIELYGRVVGNVQITELDISASSDYDGSEEAKEAEYEKLRKRYNMIYFGICGADAKDDVNVTGITFWGTVDHYSWLQSRSNVGGGNTTGLPQCPLLFDENYEPKSAFYVFTNTK